LGGVRIRPGDVRGHLLFFGTRSRPVLALPACSSASLRLAGAACYPSPTWKKRLVRIGMRVCLQPGLCRLFLWSPSHTDRGVAIHLGEITKRLGNDLGLVEMYPVMIWPAPERGPRLHVHLLDGQGRRVAFAKVVLSGPHTKQLKNEATVLRRLAEQHLRTFHVPTVLAYGEEDGWSYLAVEALPGGARLIDPRYDRFPTEAVAEFGGPIRHITRAELQRLAWWSRFEVNCHRNRRLLELVRSGGQASIRVRRIHGDLGSENLFIARGRLWIIDWEESVAAGPHLTDEVAYRLGGICRATGKDRKGMYQTFFKMFVEGASASRKADVILALGFLDSVRFKPASDVLTVWSSSEGFPKA